MHTASRAIGVILICLAATQAHAAALSFPERGRSAVVDAAGVIPDRAEAELDARVMAWNRSTGHQLVVATVPSLQGREIPEYSTGLLRHWRLGSAGGHDGVILLLAPNERRQVRIEVGYGLEGVLTDAMTSAIIRDTIRPALRTGDIAGALTVGAERIMQAATPGAEEALPAPPRDEGQPLSWWWIIFAGLGCLILGIFLYPLFEMWFAIWPFYVIMPARAKRAEARHDAKSSKVRLRQNQRPLPAPHDGRTNNLSTVRAMAESMRAKLRQKQNKARSRHDRHSGGSDALEALRDRAQRSADSSSYDNYDSGGSSDSGFDGGGGSSGGGGADSDY